jgi:hypothetical protein
MAAKLVKTRTPGVYRRGPSYAVRYRHKGEELKRYARTYEEARSIKQAVETDTRRAKHREAATLTLRGLRQDVDRHLPRARDLARARSGRAQNARSDSSVGAYTPKPARPR